MVNPYVYGDKYLLLLKEVSSHYFLFLKILREKKIMISNQSQCRIVRHYRTRPFTRTCSQTWELDSEHMVNSLWLYLVAVNSYLRFTGQQRMELNNYVQMRGVPMSWQDKCTGPNHAPTWTCTVSSTYISSVLRLI